LLISYIKRAGHYPSFGQLTYNHGAMQVCDKFVHHDPAIAHQWQIDCVARQTPSGMSQINAGRLEYDARPAHGVLLSVSCNSFSN
jgi:hypothetical protein